MFGAAKSNTKWNPPKKTQTELGGEAKVTAVDKLPKKGIFLLL